MTAADSPGRRITFMRTFIDLAWSVAGRAQLKALLAGTLAVPGVRLSSRDRFRIITRLLALDDADAEGWLAAQVAADTSDEGARYAFAAAAARRDAAAKRALHQRFLEDPLLPESWIDAALGPFNSIGHAALTAPLLERSLEALPDLKRRRKIFFVNDWLSSFIGGQQSRAALEQVERFAARSDLDADLRLKVLEVMDGLARAVRIRSRYAGA